MPATSIVTGAAGFIGSHLAASLLARGERVVGVDNFDPFYDRALKQANLARLKGGRFELIEADIRDAAVMRPLVSDARPESVFHIAALAGVRPSIADPAAYASVNVDGLVSVLDAARLADCRRVIFASSSSVYGNSRKVPFAETDPVDEPISPYAATKRAGELICHAYAHLFGLRIAALRFFTVYGPAQRPDLAIAHFMRLIAENREVPMFGDGSMSRDYTFIDDIIHGVLAAHDLLAQRCESSRPGELRGGGFFRIFNLGSSHPIRLDEMIDRLGRVVGRSPRMRKMPLQPGDVEQTFADLTRSESELRYRPRTDFDDGLRKQWDWVRSATASMASAT